MVCERANIKLEISKRVFVPGLEGSRGVAQFRYEGGKGVTRGGTKPGVVNHINGSRVARPHGFETERFEGGNYGRIGMEDKGSMITMKGREV